ncbi:MAG: hypothetical protein HC773_14690 [Scytonema sp. CRU_2_7]|nr:hypothetical protein [Scytonema sp. CRU_2_7]
MNLFGSSDNLGEVKIFWEQQRKPQHNSGGKNPTYSTQGILYIYSQKNQSFIQQVVQFAYVMGGFGKLGVEYLMNIFSLATTKITLLLVVTGLAHVQVLYLSIIERI